MKFRSFSAIRFGCFTDKTVDFSEDVSLHILYGPNETGKSTLLRALTDSLYGIPMQSPDNHQHEYRDLRLRAVVEGMQGSWAFQRRKGAKDTILDDDGQALGDDILLPLLQGVDRQTFLHTFGLDHASLRAGGRSLVTNDNETGQSIFQAATGLDNVSQLLKTLGDEADTYLRQSRRGKNQRLSTAVERYRTLEKQKSDALLRPQVWKQAVETKSEAKAAVAALLERLQATSAKREKLRRIKTTLPHIASLHEVKAKQQDLGELSPLPEHCGERRQQAEEQRRRAVENTEETTMALQRLQKNLETLTVDERILACAEAIENLQREVGSYRSNQRKIKELSVEAASLDERMRRMRQELLPGADVETMAVYRLPLLQRQQFEELMGALLAQRRDVERLAHECEKLESDSSVRAEALADLAPFVDLRTVKVQLQTARSWGDLDSSLRKARTTIKSLEKRVDLDCQAAGYWQGSAAALLACSLPSQSTINGFRQRFDDWQDRHTKNTLDQEHSQSTLAEQKDFLHGLERQGRIATDLEWQAARARRDDGWVLVRGQLEQENVSPETIAAYAGEQSLADRFEKDINESDGVAKSLVKDSTQAARKTQAQEQIRVYEARLTELKESAADLQKQHGELSAAWQQPWQEWNIRPGTPADMAAWLTALDDIREKYHQLQEQKADLETLEDQQNQGRQALAAAWADIGQQAPPSLSWSEFLAWTEALVAELDGKNQLRQRLLDEEKVHEKQIQRTSQAVETARKQLGHWQEQWRQFLAQHQWPQDLDPGAAETFLKALDKYFQMEEELLQNRNQTATLTEAVEAVQEEGQRVQRLLDDQHAPPAVDAAIVIWAERLNTQLQAAERRRSYLEAQAERQEKLEQAAGLQRQAESQLLELLDFTDCPDATALRELEAKHAQKEAWQKEQMGIEKTLLQLGEGLSLQELETEAAVIEQDGLVQTLQQLDQDLAELQQEYDAQRETLGAATKELRDMEEGQSTAAIEFAQEQQAILGQLEEDIAVYIRTRTAQFLLQRAIKNYLAAHQGPLLAQASQWFPILTGGSFADLIIDYGKDDKPVLYGVRPDGSRITVEGMSDGSQDQLYLALRLASLAVYHEQGITMPFVLDDILVHFDDQRAGQALQALQQLSRTHQVIFFTHHIHLFRLAEKTLASGAELITL